MSEADFYPAGAYTAPNAPFNEPIIPARDFEIDVECLLKKKRVVVTTNNYVPEYEDETGHTNANTENTDWEDVFNKSHYTIPDLLNILRTYVNDDLIRYAGWVRKERELKEILDDCDGWVLNDTCCTESE